MRGGWTNFDPNGPFTAASGAWPPAEALSLVLALPLDDPARAAIGGPEDPAASAGRWMYSEQPLSECAAVFRQLLEDSRIEKVLWNAQSVLAPAARIAPDTASTQVSCVRTMCWMLDSAGTYAHFEDALTRHLPTASAPPQGAPQRRRLGTCLRASMWLHAVLSRRLAEDGCLSCFRRVESRLPWLLARVHASGFPLEVGALEASQRRIEATLAAISKEAEAASGEPGFNLQSADHVRAVLFERLRLHEAVPNLQKTRKRGLLSTGEETLRALVTVHPLPALILKYRKLSKLLSTYVRNLSQHAKSLEGTGLAVVYPTFIQEGTDTGRLSCSAPNLQNQPRKGSEEDQAVCVRSAFRPFPGELLASFDYGQIEVCVLAHVSGDAKLCALLRAGGDMHRNIAAQIFERPPEQVSPGERQAGKRVVFGTIYGQGPRGLSQQLGCSVDRAQALLSAFRRSFPGAQDWMARTVADCRSSGVVRTFTNRTRRLPNINSPDPGERAQAERQAVNTVVQGSAADIIKLAMLQADGPARACGMRLLCQVHDEIIFSGTEEALRRGVPAVREAMERAVTLAVPLRVNVEAGSSWGSLAPWDEARTAPQAP